MTLIFQCPDCGTVRVLYVNRKDGHHVPAYCDHAGSVDDKLPPSIVRLVAVLEAL